MVNNIVEVKIDAINAESFIQLVKDNVDAIIKPVAEAKNDVENKKLKRLLLDHKIPENLLDEDLDLSEQVLNVAAQYAQILASERDMTIFRKDEEKRIVYGVVAEPGMVDADNHTYSAEHIEECAHRYLADFREKKLSHFLPINADIVESYCSQTEWKAPDGQIIKQGSWIAAMRINDVNLWKDTAIGGKIKGFSMGGVAEKL